MPAATSKIVRSPLEKSLKSLINENESFKYSKNISHMEEKDKEGVLFPKNDKTPKKITFDFEPNNSYISFRENLHLSILGKIKVVCNKKLLAGALETTDTTFALNEEKMKIYLPGGINKFIKNVKCTFNNNVPVNCSTLAFQDFNTFELYHNIETSLLKDSDEFKASNRQLGIVSQMELSGIKDIIKPEKAAYISELDNLRCFQSTLPCYPFRKYPSFIKNRIKSTLASNPNIPTVSFFLNVNSFFCSSFSCVGKPQSFF